THTRLAAVFLYLCSSSGYPRDLHSFPTRRSSDLDERRCSDVASEFCDLFRLRWAFREARLLLMTCAILYLLISLKALAAGAGCCRGVGHTAYKIVSKQGIGAAFGFFSRTT